MRKNLITKSLLLSSRFYCQSKIYTAVLVILFFTVISATAKSILTSKSSNNPFQPYQFPQTIPLASWQLSKSEPLKLDNQSSKYDETLAGRTYIYSQKSNFIGIEARYIVATLGDNPYLISQNTSIASETTLNKIIKYKYLPNIGFSSYFVYQGQAHLSSCINSRGGSTATGAQFSKNRRIHDLRLERLLPVLLGEESVQDRRCLWIYMSMPLKNLNDNQAHHILEQVWIQWFDWWKFNFPQI